MARSQRVGLGPRTSADAQTLRSRNEIGLRTCNEVDCYHRMPRVLGARALWYGICWVRAGCISLSSTLKTLQHLDTLLASSDVKGPPSPGAIHRTMVLKAKSESPQSSAVESVQNGVFNHGADR